MDDETCANCQELYQAAIVATVQHVHGEYRLERAKWVLDSQNIRDLESLVESLLQVRSAATQAYREHIDSHAEAKKGV